MKTVSQKYNGHFTEVYKKFNNTFLFASRHWIFQQCSAPTDKAKTNTEDWTSRIPDLNSLALFRRSIEYKKRSA